MSARERVPRADREYLETLRVEKQRASARAKERAEQTLPEVVLRVVLALPYAEAKARMVAMFDEAFIACAMSRAAGNVSEAARLSGLDRANFKRIRRAVQARRRSDA